MSRNGAVAQVDTPRRVATWVLGLALLTTVVCLRVSLPSPSVPEQPVDGSTPPEHTTEPAESAEAEDLAGASESGFALLHGAFEKNPGEALLQLLDAADRSWTNVDGFRAQLVREMRRGRARDREEIVLTFHKPYCAVLEWTDASTAGRRAHYVRGRYDDLVSLKVRFFADMYVARELDDPSAPEHIGLGIDELSFGATLAALREKAEAGWSVRYLGRQQIQSDGSMTLAVALELGGERHQVHFDSESLMPVRIEIVDGEGIVRLHEYSDVVLDPVDPSGRKLLDAATFYRSTVFPEQWEKPGSESWTLQKTPDGRWTVGR